MLVKLINSYLDYNSTSPLSSSVQEMLKGEFSFWANPSSTHSLGKKARQQIEETRDFLFDLFFANSSEARDQYHLIFHSGATEGLNALYQSLGTDTIFFYSPLDHAVTVENAKRFKKLCPIKNDDQASLDDKSFISQLSQVAGPKAVAWPWMNNELGVIWDWEKHLDENYFFHVDATQTPFKMKDCFKLKSYPTSLTYSGHKFGALKGIGWSFVKKTYPYRPLLLGGGQQQGLRAGTENSLGVMSLRLALEDGLKNWQPQLQQNLIEQFRHELSHQLQGQGEVLAIKNFKLNLNTVAYYMYKTDAQTQLIHYDLQGLMVGSGSACSSGVIQDNRLMKELGFSNYARNAIRLSFSPFLTEEDFNSLKQRIFSLLPRFFSKS